MTFGEHIRELRKEKKLSLRDAAKLIGINYVYLHRIEQGFREDTGMEVHANAELVSAIARAYLADEEYLLALAGFLPAHLVFLARPEHKALWDWAKTASPEDVRRLAKVVMKSEDLIETRKKP